LLCRRLPDVICEQKTKRVVRRASSKKRGPSIAVNTLLFAFLFLVTLSYLGLNNKIVELSVQFQDGQKTLASVSEGNQSLRTEISTSLSFVNMERIAQSAGLVKPDSVDYIVKKSTNVAQR